MVGEEPPASRFDNSVCKVCFRSMIEHPSGLCRTHRSGEREGVKIRMTPRHPNGVNVVPPEVMAATEARIRAEQPATEEPSPIDSAPAA